MLILPVGFSVVTDNPIGIGDWSCLGVCRGDFSVKRVVESLEETVSKIHISNNINTIGEVDASWHLSVSVSPVVLNSLHMPLVDDHNDFLMGTFVDGLEEIFISLINENLFEFWEEKIKGLNIPVHKVRIKASLGVLRWLRVMKSRNGLSSFAMPEIVSKHHKSLEEINWGVQLGFVVESRPSFLIEFSTKEISFGSYFLSFFTGEFDFKTWFQESVVCWDSEMEFEHSGIGVEFKPEHRSSSWEPHGE